MKIKLYFIFFFIILLSIFYINYVTAVNIDYDNDCNVINLTNHNTLINWINKSNNLFNHIKEVKKQFNKYNDSKKNNLINTSSNNTNINNSLNKLNNSLNNKSVINPKLDNNLTVNNSSNIHPNTTNLVNLNTDKNKQGIGLFNGTLHNQNQYNNTFKLLDLNHSINNDLIFNNKALNTSKSNNNNNNNNICDDSREDNFLINPIPKLDNKDNNIMLLIPILLGLLGVIILYKIKK